MKKTTKNFKLHYSSRSKKAVAFLLSVLFTVLCCPISFAAESSSNPLTPSELAQMSEDEVAAISQEQSDATLDKMVQLFQDGKKDALNEYLSALGFATSYEEYVEQNDKFPEEPSIQPLWQSDTWGNAPEKQCHETLTSSGFFVYLAARNLLFNGGTFGYTLAEMKTLSDASAYPDKIGWIILYKDHFYDPDTGTNWKGESFSTARDSARFYYQEAVKKFQSGDRNGAIQSLAYSIHYVQDVGVPHHSANKIAGSSNHSDFEALASQILLDDELELDLEEDFEYDISFYNKCASQDIGAFVHEIASTTKPLISVAADENNISGQRLLIAFLLPYSMQNTSGVLYKFAEEVGMI